MSYEPTPSPQQNGTPPTSDIESEPHATEAGTQDPSASRVRKTILREYAEAIIIAMILAFTIRVFVVQAFKIPSGSMIPSLMIGDHILVNKMSYGLQWPQDCKIEVSFPPITCYSAKTLVDFGLPHRGDVIVFRFPEDEEKDFIKRIVGEPGDTIHILNKIVYINDQPFQDKEFTQRIDPGIIDGRINPRDNFGPITVPPDSYFVMGDNRDQSLDGRFWGYVKTNKIKGRAFLVYWSWSGQGAWSEWVRWERIAHSIQ